jgi:RNA polymerase sigma-70 factor (ECF subfamily)
VAHEALSVFMNDSGEGASRLMDSIQAVKHLSDEELASKVATGSRSSFEELVSRYSSRLFYFLRHRFKTDQDIEDLIQETFLKAFRNIERFSPERKFSTWLYTIAIRQAISRFRSEKKISTSLDPASSPPGPEDIVIQKEESQNIWHLASKLGERQYEALWLHYGEDMPIKEMAKILNKKPITVRVLLHRARLNLGKRMEQPITSGKLAGTTSAAHKFSFL